MGAVASSVDACEWLSYCPGSLLSMEDREGLPAQPPPASVSPLRMSIDLQRKLGRGATYNLKLLLRGDLQTGKTSMWRRLQGLPHSAGIPPTRELGVAHLDWTCDTSPDVVKCEVNASQMRAHPVCPG